METKLFALFLTLVCPAFIPLASGQTADSWVNPNNGSYKWETASDWSLGVPPSQAQSVMITNNSSAAAGGSAPGRSPSMPPPSSATPSMVA